MGGLFQTLNEFVAIGKYDDVQKPDSKKKLIKALKGSSYPWVGLAVSQVEKYKRGQSRAIVDTTQSDVRFSQNLIFAEFRQRFNPHLALEWLLFEDADCTTRIHDQFPSKSRPIRIVECSSNLEVKIEEGKVPRVRSVVIFPEDWKYPLEKSASQLNSRDVFFFVDRFSLRTQTYSLPILFKCLTETTFVHLRRLLKGDQNGVVERLCSDWLGPHEMSHRIGILPFAVRDGIDFRPFKNNRPAGGFEEMRADVNAILALQAVESDDNYEQSVAEFITLERLFRYPVQHLAEKKVFDSKKRLDYDSIGSQLLVRFLKDHGYLNNSNGKVGLTSNYLEGLHYFSELAKHIDAGALNEAMKKNGSMHTGRELISIFVERSTGYDSRKKRYPVDPVFQDLMRAILV